MYSDILLIKCDPAMLPHHAQAVLDTRIYSVESCVYFDEAFC